jgi:methyltransferase (TIGR00027 family)
VTSAPPSATAQRVAAYRLSFDRLGAPFGDPAADERLARDVAADAQLSQSERMRGYLRARTAFFDRVVVNAISRDVSQIVILGAGYDGRALRYARDGVRWWEVDRSATQDDKQARLASLGINSSHVTFVAHDLELPGLAAALTAGGFEPDAPALVCCEGVALYLTPVGLGRMLGELRSLATPGTRLAISARVAADETSGNERNERLHAAVASLGEPARSSMTSLELAELFARARWRTVDISDRSQKAGFIVAAPVWSATPADGLASYGHVAGRSSP